MAKAPPVCLKLGLRDTWPDMHVTCHASIVHDEYVFDVCLVFYVMCSFKVLFMLLFAYTMSAFSGWLCNRAGSSEGLLEAQEEGSRGPADMSSSKGS